MNILKNISQVSSIFRQTIVDKINEIVQWINNYSPTAISVDSITEYTPTNGIIQNGVIIEKHIVVTTAINTSRVATATEIKSGWITSTSPSGVLTITLPTGTNLGAALGATKGTVFNFYIDNTGGANQITIAANTNAVYSDFMSQLDGPLFSGEYSLGFGAYGLARFTIMFSSATAYAFTRTA